MIRCHMPRFQVLSAAVLVLLLASTAAANTITLGIGYLPPTYCDDSWVWVVCPSVITQTVFGDPGGPGHCYWTQPSGRIKMYPARLEVDVAALAGIEMIQVDINELEFAGQTKAMAYVSGSSTAAVGATSTKMGTHTLSLDVSGIDPAKLAVACYDCEVTQVRLVSGTTIVPLEAEAWGMLKTRFTD